MGEMNEDVRELIVDRVGRMNTSLIGRAWETHDPKERQEFAEWFLRMVERLGLEVSVK